MTTYHVVNLDDDFDVADDAFELKLIKDDELRVYNGSQEYKFVIDLMKHRGLIDFRKTSFDSSFTDIIILVNQSVIPNQFIMFIKKILSTIKQNMNGHTIKAYMTHGLIFFETNAQAKSVIMDDTLESTLPDKANLEFNIVIKKFTSLVDSIDGSQSEASMYWLSLLASNLKIEYNDQPSNDDNDGVIWI